MSGTVIGGVIGRLAGGIVAADVSWAASFVLLGSSAASWPHGLWAWLPPEQRPNRHPSHESGLESSIRSHLRHPQLLATYAVGFCMLCTQVAMFTYVPFRLAAPPLLAVDRATSD